MCNQEHLSPIGGAMLWFLAIGNPEESANSLMVGESLYDCSYKASG